MIEQAMDTHGFKAVPESGTAPQERMPNANRRRERVQKVIRDDKDRNRFDTRIKGCADGNPPYNQAKLRKHAQSHRDNTNYMEFYASIKAGMVPLIDLLSGSAHYANIRLKLEDPTISTDKSAVASEEWDRLLKESRTFEHNILMAMSDRRTYGKGFLGWNDPYCVEPRWFNRFNVHVPPRTQACVEYLEELIIEEEMQVCNLWKAIKSAKAGEVGWKEGECRKAIRRASPIDKFDEYHPDQQQASRADHDTLDSESLAIIKAAHHFVKEFDGTISHYIIELDGAAYSTPLPDKGPGDHLYASPSEYKNWDRAFWATFEDVTDGSWNGSSGMGKIILKPVEIKNRLYGAAVDAAFLRSSINLQATTEANYGKTAIIQQGPVTVLPPGYTPINAAGFIGDIESVLALDESIYRKMGRNTGIYAQVPDKQEGNPLSATGEVLRQQHTAVLTNSSVSRFYRDADALYAEMYRRTVSAPESTRSDSLKEFFDRCEERGVTLKDLRRIDYVRAQRNSGNGSLVMRQQNLAQMANIMPLFPPAGQEQWARDSVSALTNFDTASRYMPNSEAGEDITHHHQIAALENDSLAHGSPAIYSPQDNHVIHAQIHLQNATGAIQSLEQGGDPAAVLAALDMVMPHASMHIAALEGNPARQNEAKLLRKQWNDIAKITDELRKNVQKMQQQQSEREKAMRDAEQIQAMQDPESIRETAKMQRDLNLKDYKTKVMLQQKDAKDKANMALADTKTAADIQQSTARTMSEIQISQAKAASEIEINKKKAEAQPTKEKE